jgi:alkanesulfonate monooxygenase SsuD/methylene tetrahydromethanopterin reductase-like flavin-dependent oxidoreductase (luciferase family)
MTDDAALEAFDAWWNDNFDPCWNYSGCAKAGFLAGAAWSARAPQEATDEELAEIGYAAMPNALAGTNEEVVRAIRAELARLGLRIVKVRT